MDARAQKDEIDLLEAAVKLVRFIMRNLVWAILFPLVGLLAGYFRIHLQETTYESQMMIRGVMLAEDELGHLLLNYQKTTLPGLTKDEQDTYVKEFQFRVYAKESSVFGLITCVVTDTMILKKIEQGLLKQLDSEKLVQMYYSINQNFNKKMVTEYEEKIRKAEGMIARRNDIEMIQGFPGLMELYTKREEFGINLKSKSIITLVNGFRPIPIVKDTGRAMFAGFIGGIVAAMLFLFLKFFISFYRKTNTKPD